MNLSLPPRGRSKPGKLKLGSLPENGVEKMQHTMSVKFCAASKEQSTISRSNRLFSVTLSHFVTDTGQSDHEDNTSNSDNDSDGDIAAMTLDENAGFFVPLKRVPSIENVQLNILAALQASNGLRWNTIDKKEQDEIVNAMIIETIPRGNSIVKKGDIVKGVIVVISEGTAVSDTASGEWYSRGKLFNAESLAFAQNVSPYSLRAGDQGAVIATLPTSQYSIANSLRINYLRSKYSILDTLNDSNLKHFHPRHIWINANDGCVLNSEIALITHGVTRMEDLTNTERMFPGQTVGVCELMQSTTLAIVADTFVGCAIINDGQFKKFMRQRLFMNAINDITYQRSVVLQNFDSTVIDSVLESEPEIPIVFTTRLCKTYDEKGTLKINQYRVIKKIGSGATAAVFKVNDENICKHRVMKIVKRKDSEKSLKREIHALKTLVHPNVIRAYDVIDCDQASVVILVQELAEWGSLLGVVLSMQETKACAIGCIRALKHLHNAQLIHGDIKPANILRSKTGQIKLADFGCTTHIDEEPDPRPQGTPAFMAPEVFENKVCQQSDIWALTVSLYCLILEPVKMKRILVVCANWV
jgi:tRNA A-37 threonylcarbamoyl transferase component Bud32